VSGSGDCFTFGPRRRAAALVGWITVLVDLAFFPGPVARTPSGHLTRLAILAVALLLIAGLGGWRREALGLGRRIRPSARYWLLILAALAGAGALLLGGAILHARMTGRVFAMPGLFNRREDFWYWSLLSVVSYPLIEEGIYRLVLCSTSVGLLGRWPTILLSGALFALLHVRYGVIAPNNMAAGFLLAWAFLRSEQFAVPLGFHAAGNLALGLVRLWLLPG